MAANTHTPTRLRAQLTVETLEGRAMPAVLISQPLIDGHLATASVLAGPAGSQAALPVISRIFVNGQRVMTVQGKPAFAAIGPAASGNQNGQTESGGTTFYVNDQAVGTFQSPPQITRTITIRMNAEGALVRVLSYHITGTPYLPPAAQTIGGVWVG